MVETFADLVYRRFFYLKIFSQFKFFVSILFHILGIQQRAIPS